MTAMTPASTNALSFHRFENLSRHAGLFHTVSTRLGGISQPPYDTLNLSYHVGDDPNAVIENRDRFSASTGVPLDNMVFCKQAHSAIVTNVGPIDRGRGARSLDDAIGPTDAIITADDNTCLVVVVADCTPILIFDPVQRVVAAVHAGWRGTVARIVYHTVLQLKKDFNCDPKDLIVGIGPSIGPDCYQVGQDVLMKIREANLPEAKILRFKSENDMYFDLHAANRLQLMDAGVLPTHIESADICSHCATDQFFSARRMKPTGRFAAAIMLR
jgi:YfiH family protein